MKLPECADPMNSFIRSELSHSSQVGPSQTRRKGESKSAARLRAAKAREQGASPEQEIMHDAHYGPGPTSQGIAEETSYSEQSRARGSSRSDSGVEAPQEQRATVVDDGEAYVVSVAPIDIVRISVGSTCFGIVKGHDCWGKR